MGQYTHYLSQPGYSEFEAWVNAEDLDPEKLAERIYRASGGTYSGTGKDRKPRYPERFPTVEPVTAETPTGKRAMP